MKKRILSLLLALVMVLGLIPAMRANALTYEMADAVIVNNVGLDDGYYVLEGSTEAKKGTPPADADYAYFKDRVLYLKNFDITTHRDNQVDSDKWVKCGIGIFQYAELYWDDSYLGSLINDFPLRIHLTGENRITDSTADYSIYACYEASVTFTGDGTLEMNRPMEVTGGITVKGGTFRMKESGAGDQVPMVKTATFKMEGGNLNMRAAYRSGIECNDFSMSSGNLDMTILGNSQYSGSGLLTTGSVSIAGGTVKILSDGDAVQCSSLSIQNGTECAEFVSTAGSGQDSSYMAVDASVVTLPTNLSTVVSKNSDDSSKTVLSGDYTGNLAGYDYVKCAQPITYVVAKSTEPIAGTVNTAPTITIDPECHCKVSDYAEGYWMYYTKGLGWRRMEENTKFVADKDYAYYFAIETTDGYAFPADGGNVNGILQCDQGYFGATVNRVEGRDDVAEMMLTYQPCTYGAPLEFSEQTPVTDFTNSALYEMEGILGQEYLFRFNHKPLTDEQKAKGFTIERTLMVSVGSLTNFVHKVQNDTGTQPLSYNLTIDQAQTYLVTMAIILKKDGTTLQTKGGVYQIKVVAGGTPVVFTADSSNSFGGTVTVDIDAMAETDYELMEAYFNDAVKYQWYRDASQIPGANGQSYTFHADDVGKKIKVAVFYGDNGSISEPFTVTGTAPAFTTQPTGGDVAPGSTKTIKWATSFTPTKIVVDKYNFVGLASEYTTLSGTATSIELPANECGYVIKAYYNDTDFITSNKFTVMEKETVYYLVDFTVEGSRYDIQTVEEGKPAVKPADPTMEGYTFKGWYLGNSAYDFSKAVTSNITLTAKWEKAETPTEPKPTDPPATEPKPDDPKVEGVTRLAGENRLVTSELIANQLKLQMGVEKFENIIVASGGTFADALPGSYLAAVKNAPILLTLAKDKYVNQTAEYIKANLKEGGTVYILGGESAVPASMEKALNGLNVQRVAGKDRFGTNLEILKEAGVKPGDEILVCTAKEFADSLSAAATGKPILLVYKKITDEQKAYLGTLSGNTFCVVGGTSAVPENLEEAMKAYGNVSRLAGKDRLDTSILVAKKYFPYARTSVVAYGWDFPDGLCGGSLAYATKSPLILAHSKEKLFKFTADYTVSAGLKAGFVLGGDKLVTDQATRAIFGMAADGAITVLK